MPPLVENIVSKILPKEFFNFQKNLLEFSTHKITHFYTKEFLPASFLLTRRHIKSRAHICSSKKIVKTVLPDYGGFSRIFFFQLLFDFQIWFFDMNWSPQYLILLLNINFLLFIENLLWQQNKVKQSQLISNNSQ